MNFDNNEYCSFLFSLVVVFGVENVWIMLISKYGWIIIYYYKILIYCIKCQEKMFCICKNEYNYIIRFLVCYDFIEKKKMN